MNEIVNTLLLAGDKFMLEMHLKQPGFTDNACGPFTKNKERIQKFKETGDTSYIYKNELMQLISKFNKGFRFLLCVIDIFIKYAWVDALKDKKGVSIVNGFQKILDKSERKPNKIWIDKGSQFYNNYFKKWLKVNDVEMC